MHVNTETHFTKTQYSEILVEYEKGFDMTTGKTKVDPYATSHPPNEGTSYIPVHFQKNTGQPGGHLKPQDDQKHTFTRTITNE